MLRSGRRKWVRISRLSGIWAWKCKKTTFSCMRNHKMHRGFAEKKNSQNAEKPHTDWTFGGSGGIRTHEPSKGLPDFESGPLWPLRYASVFSCSKKLVQWEKTAFEKCKKTTQEEKVIRDERISKMLMIKPKWGDETTSIVSDFECCTFDHSDNSPSMFLPSYFSWFSKPFRSQKTIKSGLERTDGKNCKKY